MSTTRTTTARATGGRGEGTGAGTGKRRLQSDIFLCRHEAVRPHSVWPQLGGGSSNDKVAIWAAITRVHKSCPRRWRGERREVEERVVVAELGDIFGEWTLQHLLEPQGSLSLSPLLGRPCIINCSRGIINIPTEEGQIQPGSLTDAARWRLVISIWATFSHMSSAGRGQRCARLELGRAGGLPELTELLTWIIITMGQNALWGT